MKKEFNIAIIISAVIHTGLILFVALHNWHVETPLGDGIVVVEMVGEGENKARRSFPPNYRRASADAQDDLPSASHLNTSTLKHLNTNTHTGNDDSTNSNDGNNSAESYGSPAGNPILTQIRTKIERVKYYPTIAKRQGLVGRPELSFQINSDGSATNIKVIKSSGNQILDDAAVETIKQAGPYPSYSDPISLSINFSLD